MHGGILRSSVKRAGKVLPGLFALLFFAHNAFGQNYTFTTAGAKGQNGPTQSQINTEYSGTNLNGKVSVTGGIQYWTVPFTGLYKITALGAQGYGTYGGRGASMTGEFLLKKGDVLKILVGQKGAPPVGLGTNQYGGGGGSFVTYSNNTPIIVAGGGGGSWASSYTSTTDASTSTSGNSANNGPTNGAGGTSGGGGAEAGIAGGGGGLTGNGGGNPHGGRSFVNGGTGGRATTNGGEGGFGGGGGANSYNNRRGGGGGGYSGGGGAGSTTTGFPEGGGGGSYNAGNNQANLAGINTGDGKVIIETLSSGAPNDAGVVSIDSPNVYCPGKHNVVATIINFGSKVLDTVTVNWSVDGTTQTPVQFTGSLDTAGGSNSTTAQVTLGSYTFTSASYEIRAWTTSPNNAADTVNQNDTTSATKKSSLPPPTGLATAALDSTEATISWTGGSLSNSWLYLNVLAGQSPSGTGTSVSADSVVLTGLSPRTSYDFYVREVCSSGDTSSWAGPLSYRTPCTGPLSGNYTVNPGQAVSNKNFISLSDVASALSECGVSGPVKFSVASGTYTGRLVLTEVPGASATNTVIFDGGSPSSVTLKNTGSSTTDMATVLLDGADYITIKNMRIEANGSSYGVGVHFANSADYNVLTDNEISVTIASNTNLQPILGSGSSTTLAVGDAGDYNLIANNVLRGGYYGIRYYGSSTTSQGMGNRFVNNDVSEFSTYGMYIYYQNYVEILDNKSYKGTKANGTYGCYIYYPHNFIIERNQFRGGSYNYLYYANYASPYNSSFTSSFSNNMVVGGTTYGLYFYYGNHLKFQHNSIYVPSGTYGIYGYNVPGTDIDMRNNIIVNGSGTALYLYNENLNEIDYNIYQGSINLRGTVYGDLAAWQAAYPQYNQHSLDQAPGFKSATDLHLDATGLKPYGPDLGYTEDVDGDKRCRFAPTIGADESDIGKNVRPTAAMTIPDTLYVNSPTEVLGNVTPGVPHTNLWYVDGTFVKDSVDLLLTLSSTGTYTVKVVAQGCSLKDSTEKTVVVVNPTKVPAPDFISSANVVKPGDIVQLTDLSAGGPTAWEWEITPVVSYDANGNPVDRYTYEYGSDKSRMIRLRFHVAGSYQVCLKSTNAVGSASVCKTAYIRVQSTYDLALFPETATENEGFIYDDGGRSGNYKQSSSTTTPRITSLLIAPCAAEVYLTFSEFELECGYDYLRIYDGEDNTGTPLHSCTSNANGNNGPGFTGTAGSSCGTLCRPSFKDTFKAVSGKMYIEMSSDNGTDYKGFEAFWWIKPRKVDPPTASFDVPSTICIDIPVSFTNMSTGESVNYLWDLDGDMSQFETTTDDAAFVYFVPGKYEVTLVAVNCGGSDTFRKEITVISPSSPIVSFTTDNTNPTTTDIVKFGPDITECVSEYRWRFTAQSGPGKAIFVNGTSDKSMNPEVTFSDTGCYDVFLYAKNSGGDDSLELSCFVRVKNAYCVPTVATNVSDIGISEVSLHTLIKKSTQGMEDYQNYVATDAVTLEAGVGYELVVKRTSNQNEANRTAWIDWNLDGDFDDAGEKIGEELKSSALTWTHSFTVPRKVTVGATVLRIAINQASFPNRACGPNKYGEYEDYRVYVTPDLTKPVITLIGSDTVYVEQGYSYTDSGATAEDNLDGNITAAIKTSVIPTFDNLVPGTYNFRFNVNDSAGNPADVVTRVVIVTGDKTAPDLVITGADTIYVAVGDITFTEPEAFSAEDLVDGDLTGDVVRFGSVDVNKVGIYTLEYNVSDFSGNTASDVRIVIVEDRIPPTLALNGTDTVYHEVNTPYTDAGVTASDNYYTGIGGDVVVSGAVDVTRPGTYTLRYTLTDSSGNQAGPVERVVIVRDTEAPVLTIAGDSLVTLEVFDTYTEPGFSATDNYGTPVVTPAGTFYAAFPDGRAEILGDYTIIYTAEDSFGNQASAVRIVRVQDTEAPSIELDGNPSANVCRWADYTDPGYTLSDNYWDTADITVTTEGDFLNTMQEGIYSFRYRAEDKSGNVAYSSWRVVNVVAAGEAGCITNLPDAEFDESLVVYPNPSAGRFVISMERTAGAQLTVRVLNQLGEVVETLAGSDAMSGDFSIDLSDRASGIYTLQITDGTRTAVRKICIRR